MYPGAGLKKIKKRRIGMKKLVVFVMVGLFTAASFGFAFAASSADQAKAMVEKAAALVKANGKEKAVKEFNDPKGQFVKGELYIFAYEMNGVVIANPNNLKTVGMNLMEMPDVDGKLFRKEGIELAKKNGSGWVDYKYKNPQSGKVEQKTSLFRKAEDIVVGCGIYK
jgi:cytochrome c